MDMLDIKHLAEAGSRHGNLTDVADPPLALNANKTILNDVLNAQADLPFPLVPNYFTPGRWKSFQGYGYAEKGSTKSRKQPPPRGEPPAFVTMIKFSGAKAIPSSHGKLPRNAASFL
ncbi:MULTISPECIES: hypothetical protein [unclassified Paenibacillus]|uniref:hypothetical protein n=1 Tax=unclassified Paenibacillus TaxID=185978 RepID=UPI001A020893|nr:hypothetical protein [Paenibacillus sp. Y412MC10]